MEKVQTKLFDLHKYLNIDFSCDIPPTKQHIISIAPMVDVTTVHFRFFMRLLSKHVTLWTEMIHENAILNNHLGPENFLKYNKIEHPVVLQIGGNNPESMAKCAVIASNLGYDELNINCGCPSPKVLCGSFGACLMKEPENVAEMCLAIKKASPIPLTIKHRLGIDDFEDYDFTKKFVKHISEAGVTHFIVHARKALLKGLSPAENRNIPPLKYDWVIQLKKDFPHLEFTINGGFKTAKDIIEILKPENNLKGCMIGRMAMDNPWPISDFDRLFYGKQNQGFSRREILEMYGEYGNNVLRENPNVSIPVLTKPLINLFAGEKSSSKYRGYLSDPKNYPNKKEPDGFSTFIDEAISVFSSVNEAALDCKPPEQYIIHQRFRQGQLKKNSLNQQL